MKSLIKRLIVIISKVILPLFYSKEYLTGIWFDNGFKGWRWGWKSLFMQKFIGYNRRIPFPISHRNILRSIENIEFHVDDINNFQNFGCFFQNYNAKITIGKGTYIAPNVGIITQNHDPNNLDKHLAAKPVSIGKDFWIGMNSMILRGVVLGDRTIVGAGAAVTKSFIEGDCVLVGAPAKIIKGKEKNE